MVVNIVIYNLEDMNRFIIRERANKLRHSQTPAERMLWTYLRKRQLSGKKFLRQHPIIFTYDTKVQHFIADFYCHEKMLIIELDGSIHDTQKEYDEMRENVLKDMGYKIIRFRNEEVFGDVQKVLRTIELCLVG